MIHVTSSGREVRGCKVLPLVPYEGCPTSWGVVWGRESAFSSRLHAAMRLPLLVGGEWKQLPSTIKQT